MSGNTVLVLMYTAAIIITIVSLWNNWIFIGKDGYNLEPRPTIVRWLQIGFINCWKIATFQQPLAFKNLHEYTKEKE